MKTLIPILASTILVAGLISQGAAAETKTPAKVVSKAPSDPEVKADIDKINAMLLDGKGTIIGRNLRGPALEAAVAQALKNQ